MSFYRRAGGVMPVMPPRRHFVLGMIRSTAIAGGAIGAWLLIGMVGYHDYGRLNWVDSFYYASMILSGEGPPPDPAINGAALGQLHIFAGFYALFSGVTFITMVGVLLGPALHRFLHRFHLEISAADEPTNQSS